MPRTELDLSHTKLVPLRSYYIVTIYVCLLTWFGLVTQFIDHLHTHDLLLYFTDRCHAHTGVPSLL
jgi:hypothetical protein